MGAGSGHLGEVHFERLEYLVFRHVEEVGELPVVDAVVIHLLVVEPGGTDELVRPESMQERCTQACVGRQRPVLGKPLRERAGTEMQTKAFPDVDGNALARLALVVADGLIGINATAEFGLCNTNTTAYEVADAVIKVLQTATN
jgi:hypothetical protein